MQYAFDWMANEKVRPLTATEAERFEEIREIVRCGARPSTIDRLPNGAILFPGDLLAKDLRGRIVGVMVDTTR